MTPLRIVVRTNTPWSTMTMDKFLAQKEPQKPTEFFRIGKKLLPVWEQATGYNYFLYRERIRRECEKKLREIGIPLTIGADINWDTEDEALIPIDDDDILYPSITSIAGRFTDGINLVTWTRITNYLGRERQENPSFGGQLDTCNWAVRKSFLKQFNMSERIAILARHWHAAGIMSPKLGGRPKATDLLSQAKEALNPLVNGVRLKHPSVLELDETHSVYFLHSASISFLAHKIREISVDYLKTLPLHPLLENQCIT